MSLNTSEIVVVSLAALAGGGAAAAGLAISKAVRDASSAVKDAAWRGYTLTLSFKIAPPPLPKVPPAAAAAATPAGAAPDGQQLRAAS